MINNNNWPSIDFQIIHVLAFGMHGIYVYFFRLIFFEAKKARF